MALYVCGDLHGGDAHDTKKLESSSFKPNKYEENYVFQLGDFGFIWQNIPDKKEKYWMNWFLTKPWITCFIDGNHDNHKRLNNYPVTIWNGGKVHIINEHVIHLMRGQVYTINNKTIFTFGGANSIDKYMRIPDITWWEEEIPSHAEMEEAINNLNRVNNQVDYIFTHTCPSDLIDDLLPRTSTRHLDPTNKMLDYFQNNVTFNHWYFGHWHMDLQIDKYSCLYNSVITL